MLLISFCGLPYVEKPSVFLLSLYLTVNTGLFCWFTCYVFKLAFFNFCEIPFEHIFLVSCLKQNIEDYTAKLTRQGHPVGPSSIFPLFHTVWKLKGRFKRPYYFSWVFNLVLRTWFSFKNNLILSGTKENAMKLNEIKMWASL